MSAELFDLTGKVALITGGTHGIGMAIGKVLGKAGAKICVNDLMQERLDACKLEYAKDGVDVFAMVLDVTKKADVDSGISLIVYDPYFCRPLGRTRRCWQCRSFPGIEGKRFC